MRVLVGATPSVRIQAIMPFRSISIFSLIAVTIFAPWARRHDGPISAAFETSVQFASLVGRLTQVLQRKSVVVDFPDLVPFQLRRVFDRYEPWTFGELAAAHRIEPVTVTAILSRALFVGRQSDDALLAPNTFYLDKPKLPRVRIQARDVVTKVLFVNIGAVATLRRLVLDCDPHRDRFCLRVGPQVPDFRLIPLRMRQNEDARNPFDALQAERALTIEFLAAPLP